MTLFQQHEATDEKQKPTSTAQSDQLTSFLPSNTAQIAHLAQNRERLPLGW